MPRAGSITRCAGSPALDRACLRAATGTVEQPGGALSIATGAGFAAAAVGVFHSATRLRGGALQGMNGAAWGSAHRQHVRVTSMRRCSWSRCRVPVQKHALLTLQELPEKYGAHAAHAQPE